MNFADMIQEKDKLIAEIDKANAEAKRVAEVNTKKVSQLTRDIGLAKGGLDVDRIHRGMEVIAVRGDVAKSDGRKALVNKAISDLASGLPHMLGRKEFFGIKVYSGFGEQRCDCHYGCGPRHGSIVFSVGLQNRGKEPLAPDQIEDAIYYLLNLEACQAEEVKKKAG